MTPERLGFLRVLERLGLAGADDRAELRRHERETDEARRARLRLSASGTIENAK